MRHFLLSFLCIFVMVAEVPAQAISARIGTLGPGIDVSIPFSRSFSIRAGGTFFAISHAATATDDDVDVGFKGDLNWGGVRILSDWHPFRTGLRLSSGLYYNLIEINGKGFPLEPFYLNEGQANEKVFQPDQLGGLSATLSYQNKLSPYAGIGFGDGVHGRRLTFLADLGIIYLGPPTLDMKGTGMIAMTANQDARLNEGLQSFRWLPVLSIGLAVRLGGASRRN